MIKKINSGNEQGAVAVTFALTLIILIGFLALGIEAGQWYLVRAELSKATDAAALAGANNINSFLSVDTVVQDIGNENFPPGHAGTPPEGEGAVRFSAEQVGNNKVTVNAQVSASAVFARVFGLNLLPVSSSGAAQKNKVEIMLVLDRSLSMEYDRNLRPIRALSDLKTAARSFINFFAATNDEDDGDKLGLVSFATDVRVEAQGLQDLDPEYADVIKGAIGSLSTTLDPPGATNAEDALDQAGRQFTGQTGVPGDQRVQQYLVFFSDGQPTAFRGSFRRDGIDYDAVAYTGPTGGDVYPLARPTDGSDLVPALPTGDGRTRSQTSCGTSSSRWPNTRWSVLADYQLQGHSVNECGIPENHLAPYIRTTARAMAIAHAQEIKSRNIRIFAIGLGDIDQGFLSTIASGPDYVYYTPTSSDLEAIFNRVAREIRLRLVQ